MNSYSLTFVITLLLLMTWSPCEAQKLIPDPDAPAAETHSSNRKESVTITSDGKTTVKRIVTVIDGVESVVTETTDENGKITRQKSGGTIEEKSPHPWIGIRVKEISKVLRDHLNLAEDEGLLVELVAGDGPAEKAGIRAGDLLLALAEKHLATSRELSTVLRSRKVGDTVNATIMRKGKRGTVGIKLGEPPSQKEGDVPDNLTEGFGNNSVKSVDVSANGAEISSAFKAVLDDPNLPADFKKSVLDMQKMLREFEQSGKGKK
ncbi:MAG: PDZ domain-containing protein [Akkermansiaceae bacterium]